MTEKRVEVSCEEMDRARNICSSSTRPPLVTTASSNYRFNVLLSKTQVCARSSTHGQVLFKAKFEPPSLTKKRLAELSISKSASLVSEMLQGLPETAIKNLDDSFPGDESSCSVKYLVIGLLRKYTMTGGALLGTQASEWRLTIETAGLATGSALPRSEPGPQPLSTRDRIHLPTLICDSAGHSLLLALIKQSKTKRKGCEQLCLQRFKKLVENRAACAVMAFLAERDAFLEKLTCMFLKNMQDFLSKEPAASLFRHLIPKIKNESHLSEILAFLRARLGDQQYSDKGAAVVFLFIYHDLLGASGLLSGLVADRLEPFINSQQGCLTVILLLCMQQSKAFEAIVSIAMCSPMKVFSSDNWRVVFFFFLHLSHEQHPNARATQHSRLGKLFEVIVQTVLSSESCFNAVLSKNLSAWLFLHVWSRTQASFFKESNEQTLASMLHILGADSFVADLSLVSRYGQHIYSSQLKK